MTTRSDHRSFLRRAALAALVLASGCDKISKMCFDGSSEPVHLQVSACGELCEKDDQEACGRMTKLAIPACAEQHDRETCAWMCNYSPTGGKELFCDELAKLPSPPLTPTP
ncbi:MAG: hypothetical protein JNK45_30175 [Myxococcales bacterium]|nr:hypothetical protein [Myxococcales bacterium]